MPEAVEPAANFAERENGERFNLTARTRHSRVSPDGEAASVADALSPRAKALWWAWVELNYRPHAYQACALTT